MNDARMLNAFTIDLEDWFCVANFDDTIARASWPQQESRVEQSTTRMLDLLDTAGVSGTFFVLGWVAERFPDLVREVDRRGHEIACHSHMHRKVHALTPDQFEQDLSASLAVLRNLSTRPVVGYRAPSFSVTRATTWAFEIMARHGITYDSSIFPIGGHPDYGINDAPRGIHEIQPDMLEFPMAAVEVAGRRVPTGGGGYFRLLPYAVTRALMRRHNRHGYPVSFYLHPWEIDPDQPRINAGSRQRTFRHYRNLDRTERRLVRLLADFRFGTMQQVLGIAPPPGDSP